MKMKMTTRQRVICYFLAAIAVADSVSPLLLLSSSRPPHISTHTELPCHASDPEEPTTSTNNKTRRSMLQLMIVVGSGAVTSQPAISAEIDPFAAMDEILSEGITTDGGSGTISSPGTSTTNTENESDATTKATNSSPITNSDMEAALQESKKRRKIGPTTHG
jgi:hypothetical protein